METSELVSSTNSKGIQRGLSDTSLWSFLDVSLPALCQTLLRVSLSTAPTHQPKTITHTRRMSSTKSVKSAKCQVDLMAEVGSKAAPQRTGSSGNSTETLQSPGNLDDKAFEHLLPQKNTAAFGERYPSKHDSKLTVAVGLQQSSREIGAPPTEHRRGKTVVAVNERHALERTADATHTAQDTPAVEDKQITAARTHAPTSSSRVDNGYVLDANTNRNINHNVLLNEEANGKLVNRAFEKPPENHEMKKEMVEFRSNEEMWASTELSNANDGHCKEETYSRAKPINTGHDKLLKVNIVEVCTPDVPFDKTIIQNESKNGGGINSYEVPVAPLKHIDKNKASNTNVGENYEQKRTQMHDNEEGGTFQENTHKNGERDEILECKNMRKAIKDQEEMHKNKEDSTHEMTQLLEMEQEGEISCNISDDEWNEEHENFSNYIKTSRSLIKNSRSHKKPNRSQTNKIEEQDNYDNSMKNQTATTWTSAQEDQNTFVNYTLDAKDSRGQISFNSIASQAIEYNAEMKNCENSANTKVELEEEWLQDLKDKKLRMNTNGYRYMNQRPTKEFQVITTDGHCKENSDEDAVPNTFQTNSPFTNTDHKTEHTSSDSLLRTDNADRIMAECMSMVQYKDTVENSDNMASWSPKSDAEKARMKSKDDERSVKRVTSTATGLKSLKQQVHNLNETDKYRKSEVKQSTEHNANFASTQNTSYSDEQGHSKAKAQLILATKTAENKPDNDKIEATAAVEANCEENELDVKKYRNDVKKHKKAPSEDNFSTNEINTLGGLRYNESKDMSGKWCNTVGHGETRFDKAMFHLDSITIPENASIKQNKRTVDSSMEDTTQEIDSLSRTNTIDPENANSDANVQFMLSQYAQKTEEDRNTCRNKTASKTAGLALCSNASSKQMQDTYKSSKSKDIEGYTSAQASTECGTMAPLAAICSTDEQANPPQIPTKANDHQSEVKPSDDSSFSQAMSQTETRPKRRYSSADRKISQSDVFLYSVPGSKRRSRSESLTRRRTLSREWQMLTITTTEETTIIAGHKTEVHKQIRENAVLHEKERENSRSFNLQLNTDKLQNNPTRRLGVANELHPTTFQTLGSLIINTCKTESETCVVESTKLKGTEPRSNSYGEVSPEEAATLNPATLCRVDSDKKLEEIHICASLLSHMEMHSMDNTTNSSFFNGQIANNKHELVGREIVTDSEYINDDNNKQVDQTKTKETELIVASSCMMETSPKIPYTFSNYIQPYQNVPKENEDLSRSSAIDIKTKEETQEKKISTGIGEDFQTNGSCKQKSVEIRSRQSLSQYTSEISPSREVSTILKLRDSAIQCNLAEYREAVTQTDYDILTQGEQEASQRLGESKSSDLLMFPTLQLTYVKPSDTSQRSFAIDEGNKTTDQIPEEIRKKSNFTQGNATNGHIFSPREFKSDGLEKKFVGYTWHRKGASNGTSAKTVRQKGIHRSNSLDDFCTILSTCVISEQFDSLVNHGETLIILKLLNKD